jgi:beta-phosphoglucomutase-like phosphatase (HAD superfamily)
MRRVVIFDIDGTLLELLRAESDAYLRAFDVCYGITGLSDNWDSYRFRTDIEIAREILNRHFSRQCTASELKRVLDTYELLLQREVYGRGMLPKLIPGIRNLLDTLNKQENTGLALATGNPVQISKLRLEKADIWKYFGCGAFAEDGNDKTSILSKALNRCGEIWHDSIRLEDVIFIGDHPTDVVAAQTLGVHFVRVTAQMGRLRGLISDKMYSDYRELNDFLKHLEQLWNSSKSI